MLNKNVIFLISTTMVMPILIAIYSTFRLLLLKQTPYLDDAVSCQINTGGG